MGVDVYIKCEGCKEDLPQIRCSYRQYVEVSLLKRIFPIEWWGGKEIEFDCGFWRLKDLPVYLIIPEKIMGDKEAKRAVDFIAKIMVAVDYRMLSNIENKSSENERLNFGKEIYDFFKKGEELKKKGLSPKIVIFA